MPCFTVLSRPADAKGAVEKLSHTHPQWGKAATADRYAHTKVEIHVASQQSRSAMPQNMRFSPFFTSVCVFFFVCSESRETCPTASDELHILEVIKCDKFSRRAASFSLQIKDPPGGGEHRMELSRDVPFGTLLGHFIGRN